MGGHATLLDLYKMKEEVRQSADMLQGLILPEEPARRAMWKMHL